MRPNTREGGKDQVKRKVLVVCSETNRIQKLKVKRDRSPFDGTNRKVILYTNCCVCVCKTDQSAMAPASRKSKRKPFELECSRSTYFLPILCQLKEDKYVDSPDFLGSYRFAICCAILLSPG